MKELIAELINKSLESLSIEVPSFVVEHPSDISHGDYATNVAMVLAQKESNNPRELAEKIVTELEKNKGDYIEKIEIAGPGFINFYLKSSVFVENVEEIVNKKDDFGRGSEGKKIMIEYTDPNAFKPFHIGHLMSNTIGEALSRIYEFSGNEVKRVNYYSDVGLGIAKAVWGMLNLKEEMPSDSSDIVTKTDFLGKAYAHGVLKSKDDPEIEKEAREINKKIYERTDPQINSLYQKGRSWSLEHFEELYKKLGSNFDYFIAESEVANLGKKIVSEWISKGVFYENDGAVIYEGEKRDPSLHTRVFITKDGLPTYEAKEVALILKKEELYSADESIIITANEQNDYFRVVLSAINEISPEVHKKTTHIGHGLMKLPEGKMSSRTGNVITGESLISEVKEKALGRMEDKDESVALDVSVSAIRYSVLKQGIGKDIVFDTDKSLSFEGDSGPYLQYTYARCKSLLEKAGERKEIINPSEIGIVEKLLQRFPEVRVESREENAPQTLVTYATELASAFNTYYGNTKILDGSEEEGYRLQLVEAVSQVLKNCLWILGINTPERM